MLWLSQINTELMLHNTVLLFVRVRHHHFTLLTLCRLIQHTKALLNSDEKLCIKVLRTLQEMLIRELDFDEKVRLDNNINKITT